MSLPFGVKSLLRALPIAHRFMVTLWFLAQHVGLCAFAPGFLDREASCARHLGIPAPEVCARVASPQSPTLRSARSVYQGRRVRKSVAVYTKNLTRPRYAALPVPGSDFRNQLTASTSSFGTPCFDVYGCKIASLSECSAHTFERS